MTNTFTPNITQAEQATLTKAIWDTSPRPSTSLGCSWQFHREGKYLYAWKECWAGVMVGGKAPDSLKAKSARGLADRIQLYETGRELIKGRGAQDATGII